MSYEQGLFSKIGRWKNSRFMATADTFVFENQTERLTTFLKYSQIYNKQKLYRVFEKKRWIKMLSAAKWVLGTLSSMEFSLNL